MWYVFSSDDDALYRITVLSWETIKIINGETNYNFTNNVPDDQDNINNEFNNTATIINSTSNSINNLNILLNDHNININVNNNNSGDLKNDFIHNDDDNNHPCSSSIFNIDNNLNISCVLQNTLFVVVSSAVIIFFALILCGVKFVIRRRRINKKTKKRKLIKSMSRCDVTGKIKVTYAADEERRHQQQPVKSEVSDKISEVTTICSSDEDHHFSHHFDISTVETVKNIQHHHFNSEKTYHIGNIQHCGDNNINIDLLNNNTNINTDLLTSNHNNINNNCKSINLLNI
jgi:hypothetical protein